MNSLAYKLGFRQIYKHRRGFLNTALLLIFFAPAALAQPAEDLRVSPPPGGLLFTQPQVEIRPDLGLPQFPDVNVNPTPTPAVRQTMSLDENDDDEPALTLILFALIGSLAVMAACFAMLLTTYHREL